MSNIKNLLERLKENPLKSIRNGLLAIAGTTITVSSIQTGLILGNYWSSSRYPPQWMERRVIALEMQGPSFAELPSAVPPYGQRVYLEGMTKPIFFESDNWDSTVNNGDVVTVVYTYGDFGRMFDGLFINDRK